MRRGGADSLKAPRGCVPRNRQHASAKHLVWLAAADDKRELAQLIVSLAGQKGSPLRVQALRALADHACHRRARDVFVACVSADEDPQVQLAGVTAWFDAAECSAGSNIAPLQGAQDTYLRQTARCTCWHRRASLEKLSQCEPRPRMPATRLAGVLAVGTRLTVPPATGPVPESLPLTYTSGNAFFRIAIRRRKDRPAQAGPRRQLYDRRVVEGCAAHRRARNALRRC